MPYVFELPTTGAISFSDLCSDNAGSFTSRLSDATSARAAMRGALKDNKRAGDERDFLHVVKIIDEYLPHLYALVRCLSTDDLLLRSEASKSLIVWRSTLSDNLLQTSPRIGFPGFQAELHFSHLTYGFALSNFATSIVASLGSYEKQRYSSEEERRANDERLNLAVAFLCRASGVFTYLSEVVLPELFRVSLPTSPIPRVPDVNKDVATALAKLTIADAQVLAIRKLLAKSSHDSTLSPGPPLPRGHPSPGLLAKLYLFLLDTYTSALTLATMPGSKAASTSSSRRITSPSSQKSGSTGSNGNTGEVTAGLRRYLSEEVQITGALAHKWLGIEAGEAGRSGEAITYLLWAKEQLEGAKELKLKSLLVQNDKRAREMATERKDRIIDELKLVRSFLDNYTKENNAVNFQPIPTRKTLQVSIPSGRAAVAVKPFVPPEPAFVGPNSLTEQMQGLEVQDTSASLESGKYAGAGSYF